MAQFAPVLAAIGGGSAVTGAALVATVAAGSLSARQQYIAGKEAQISAKMEAKQEADAARGREIERKRSLLRALATQNAAAGAQGVAFSGGKAAIAQTDIRDAVEDLMIDRSNTSRRAFALKRSGNQAKRQGNLNATISLIDTAGNVFGQLGPKKT